eukprot:TRINITY_DN2591_c0_g1_i1.p1 TRINITY_DN2591_c0_g1~~TRINITY_DN2591_c0_g1_i1.p1  ORF type:complete len:754 (-),score=180.98 TRINITY_DN2591_c0_g1_i1:30-2291(-)
MLSSAALRGGAPRTVVVEDSVSESSVRQTNHGYLEVPATDESKVSSTSAAAATMAAEESSSSSPPPPATVAVEVAKSPKNNNNHTRKQYQPSSSRPKQRHIIASSPIGDASDLPWSTKMKALLSVVMIVISVTGIVLLQKLSLSGKGQQNVPTNSNNSIAVPASLVLDCPIFCNAGVLSIIQLSTLFNDTKYFVDMPLKYDPDYVLAEWQLLLSDPASWSNSKALISEAGSPGNGDDHHSPTNKPTQNPVISKPSPTSILNVTVLAQFVNQFFDLPGSDVVFANLTDWNENPAFLQNIVDPTLRQYASDVNQIWKDLGRAPSADVYAHPTRHSLLSLKNPLMIVPGGRFLEEYYWDTYFVNKGLIASGMLHTAREVAENLLDFVERFGFVPNGARAYYKNRSQPPMLTLMVKDIFEAYMNQSIDQRFPMDWLDDNFDTLVKEYDFWMTIGQHAVKVQDKYVLNRYYANVSSAAPRPEMYREDYLLASNITDLNQKQQFWGNLIAAAETGWDFSSRWFSDRMSKDHTDTMNVIPVDLNVIMCKVEESLLEFSKYLDDDDSEKRFTDALKQRKEAIAEILWNPQYLQWTDFYLNPKDQEKQPLINSASNYFPFWGSCFDSDDLVDADENIIEIDYIVQALQDSGLLLPGGVSTTLQQTGQQWDFPNAWAPIQYILIDGLSNVGYNDLALELANRWIETTYLTYNSTGYMHEKYDARVLGQAGDGGEYAPQKGFGWTNGVTLDLLNRFGQNVTLQR